MKYCKYIILFLLFFCSPLKALTLEWDKNKEPDVVGYEIHYGESCGRYTKVIKCGNVTSYTIDELDNNKVYFFVVKAINKMGLISNPSNEVKYSYISNPSDKRLDVRMTTDGGKTYSTIGNIDLTIVNDPPPVDWSKIRHINVQMSKDGGVTYESIGRVPYPLIKGQKYKTNIEGSP